MNVNLFACCLICTITSSFHCTNLYKSRGKNSVKVSEKISNNPNPAVVWMALVAGLGVTLVIVALGVGVVQGEAADSNTIGLAFAAGVALFILGAIGWFGLTQPQKHFDDINVPQDTGHHGHDEHPAEHAEAEHAHAEHH